MRDSHGMHRETGATERPSVTSAQIERAIAEGRRLRGEALRKAFGRLLGGVRQLLGQGPFPARVRHRRGGRAIAGCG